MWGADFNAESGLQGWSAGYVVTYLAREGDRMADVLLASTGRAVPEFDSDRRWDLERGSLRPGAVLIDDLHESAERLRLALGGVEDWSSLDDETRAIPSRRLLQVLIHGADLGLDWQAVSVDDAERALAAFEHVREIERTGILLVSDRASERLTVSTTMGGDTVVAGPPLRLLAWATGRDSVADSGEQVPTATEPLPDFQRPVWL